MKRYIFLLAVVPAFLLLGNWMSAQQVNPQPLRITGAVVVREFLPGGADPQKAESETEFLTTDPIAGVVFAYTGGQRGDKVRVEWRNPFGALVQEPFAINLTGPGGNWFHTLPIANSAAGQIQGNWEMRIFWNDQGVANVPFRISLPQPSVVKMVNRSVLTRATIDVPYSYQLRADGGTAPYRWSTTGNLPPGLTLSPTGLITGSPSRQGSFRITVRVDDSAGNTLSRTLGLGIAENLKGARVSNSILTKLPSDPDPCAARAGTRDFAASDLNAWVSFAVEGGGPEDVGRMEWLNPYGEVLATYNINRKVDPRRCYEGNIPIAGATPPYFGNWRVRLMWRETEIASIPFRVLDESQSAVLAGRRALIVGNGTYKNLPAIPSAAVETTALAQALQQDGFDVTALQNLTLEQMQAAEREFIGKVQKGDVVLVYFTGYGLQRNGDNWLLAANYTSDNSPLATKAYSVLRLRQLLEPKEVRIAIIALDAARENPATASAGQGAGLSRMEADAHTVLVYAVPPGRTEKTPTDAKVGSFAQAFIKVIQTPSVGIQQLLLADLPKAAASLASDRPAPVSFVQTSEEFVFRIPSTTPVRDQNDSPEGRRLYGQWELGRAESAIPTLPPGRLCTMTLSGNRGRFGNVITGKVGNCNTPAEAFWRFERDRLLLVGGGGIVTSVMFKVSDEEWKGNMTQVGGVVQYLKRVAPPTGANKN